MDSRLKTMPEDFLKRVQMLFPQGLHHAIFKSYLEPKCETIRVNSLRVNLEKIIKTLQKQKIRFEADSRLPDCLYLKEISHKKITSLDIYEQGQIYLQNISSQIPPLILNPKPGEKILDLCASPGSKTSQLCALMKNSGEITAIELEKFRYDRLCHNLKLLGCSIITTHNQRGESFCRQFLATENPVLFDKILVDAPCSGDGTFYVNERASFAHWSLDFVNKISIQQKKLLLAALSVIKKDGVILYSTCSISPEENEAVVDAVLSENPNVFCLPIAKNFNHPLLKPALKNWQGQVFSKQIESTCRIYPGEKNQGFYLALLGKN